MTESAWHYDGQTAVRRDVKVSANGAFCNIVGDSGIAADIAWSDLEAMQSREVQVIYRHKEITGWRLGFPGGVPLSLSQHLPKRAKIGSFIDRVGIIPAAIGFTAVSLGVALMVMQVPAWLAPFVPLKWEKNLGVTMMTGLELTFCKGPQIEAAVKSLAKSIDPKFDSSKIHISKIDMVNAIAVPGGDIILFDGLLQKAKSADEVAGILGHEMGHVENRDVMKSLLRQFGISIALGGMDGGFASYASILTDAGFSREAEAEADEHAMKLMQVAAISPTPTAEFFKRLAKEEPEMGENGKAVFGYLNSHPLSESRERAFRASAKGQATFRPAITPDAWNSILQACKNDPSAKDGTAFF
jgi:beta-barrel assembly-enhancing protease